MSLAGGLSPIHPESKAIAVGRDSAAESHELPGKGHALGCVVSWWKEAFLDLVKSIIQFKASGIVNSEVLSIID
jgi:hypothetical protein